MVLAKEAGEGGVWRAALDLSGGGDMRDARAMAPYAHAREVGDLGFGTELSFCVQACRLRCHFHRHLHRRRCHRHRHRHRRHRQSHLHAT